MVGKRLTVSFSALALAPLLAGASAHAADYNYPPPPIIIQQPAVEFAGNWYLRGQIGIGMMSSYDLSVSPIPPSGRFASQSIGDAYFIGAGIGYEWNSWLRFDATVEYRAKSRVYALGHYQPVSPGPVFVDTYEGNLKSWVFLANAYVDLGTWDCFTPFVGVGMGGAYNTITDFSDVSPTVPGGSGSSFGVGRDTSQWNLAWALYAGVTYNVSRNFKVDLTYRYLSLGTATDTIDCNGGCGAGTKFDFKNLYSHDLMLALRWTCCELPPPPPPPPPLHSKG